MNLNAIIVAGGSGSRMGSGIPKQFLRLAGKPVLMHTIERFASFSGSIKIVVVLPENQLNSWESLCREFSYPIPHIIAAGGNSRFISVKNGLEVADDEGLVAIHDGVRPLVSRDTIKRCFKAASEFGNAIPVIGPSDSMRLLKGEESRPVDRNKIKIIQTPQVFDIKLIKKAYLLENSVSFTDDATVFEKAGGKIHLVEGNRENIKITNPEDLIICEALLPLIA